MRSTVEEGEEQEEEKREVRFVKGALDPTQDTLDSEENLVYYVVRCA